jgi:hypothetical protein
MKLFFYFLTQFTAFPIIAPMINVLILMLSLLKNYAIANFHKLENDIKSAKREEKNGELICSVGGGGGKQASGN